MRNRVGTGDSMDMKKREENSVRVTNLSEDTREEDLRVGPAPHYVGLPLWLTHSCVMHHCISCMAGARA